MSESDVQLAIIQYLQVKKIYHLRLNSGRILRTFKDKKYMINLCPTGTPDLLIIHANRPIFVEIKKDDAKVASWIKTVTRFKKSAYIAPSNRHIISQWKQHELIREAGGVVIIAGSLKELMKDLSLILNKKFT